jgi:hypothetical protein
VSKLRQAAVVCYLVGLVKAALLKKRKHEQFNRFIEAKRRNELLFERDDDKDDDDAAASSREAAELEAESLGELSEVNRECQRCLLTLDLGSASKGQIESQDLGTVCENLRAARAARARWLLQVPRQCLPQRLCSGRDGRCPCGHRQQLPFAARS